MSDADHGKKAVEEAHLDLFLTAYREVTGDVMNLQIARESPDFTCIRPSGELIGVELARSPHNFHSAIHDRIWTDRTMDAFDLSAAVSKTIASKEFLRKANDWKPAILVIELLDYAFDSLAWTDDLSLAADYSDTGFVEIWIADHSTVEAYGEVRLIGLYPTRIWGTHQQPALEQKPYG